MRPLSSVEKYRAGESREIPYDLTDPYDRAIWTALQLYVDFLERLVLQRQQELGISRAKSLIYRRNVDTRSLRPMLAWELEQALTDLRDVARGDKQRESGELYETTRSVVEALFAQEAIYTYAVPTEFWAAGKEATKKRLPDAPAVLNGVLAPLSHLIRVGLGEIVSQSEAARRLGVSVATVAHHIEAGRLPAVRIGRKVCIPAKEISKEQKN